LTLIYKHKVEKSNYIVSGSVTAPLTCTPDKFPELMTAAINKEELDNGRRN